MSVSVIGGGGLYLGVSKDIIAVILFYKLFKIFVLKHDLETKEHKFP